MQAPQLMQSPKLTRSHQLMPNTAPPTVAVHQEMQQQQDSEEFVSIWAGRSTAYTAEEEANASAEMDKEAEFQNDMDAYDSSGSTDSSMPSLISASDEE